MSYKTLPWYDRIWKGSMFSNMKFILQRPSEILQEELIGLVFSILMNERL